MRKGVLTVLLAAVMATGYGGAYAAADALDKVPGYLTLTPAPPQPSAVPKIGFTPPAADLHAQFTNATKAPVPTGEAVERVLKKFDAALVEAAKPAGKPGADTAEGKPAGGAQPNLRYTASVAVEDLSSGKQLGGRDSSKALMPASTTKVLSAITALEILGPEHRFTTATALDGDTLVLRGGNDILLAADKGNPNAVDGHAGLGDLARETAVKLRAAGKTKIKLIIDSRAAPERKLHQDWVAEDSTAYEGAPASMAIHSGKITPNKWGYVADPQQVAIDAFTAELGKAGIEINGEATEGPLPEKTEPLAEVKSAPLREVVRLLVKTSDNTLADCVARAAAIKVGKPANFIGATQTIIETLKKLQINTDHLALSDGSGLSINNRISAKTLADAVRVGASEKYRATLGTLDDAYPVGGLDGTLKTRFLGSPAGFVRAKTGTLGQATSLAGLVFTKDGRILTVSAIVNSPKGLASFPARAKLDELLTDLQTL